MEFVNQLYKLMKDYPANTLKAQFRTTASATYTDKKDNSAGSAQMTKFTSFCST